ncbi:class I SAM-dependent methyltransferase [Spirillospora sp. NPDC052269]
MTSDEYLDVNRELWDERVPIHFGSDYYDVAGFRAGVDTLRDFETAEVGDVSGRTLAHLQCHFGLDTLSWARRGATVTGLDFSEPGVEVARGLAAETGIDARFVQADVYDAREALGATFDIVYTGIGSLPWLPDLGRWAETVAALLNPGGFLYLTEFHPFADALDEETGTTVEFDYFDQSPQEGDEPGTYADRDAETRNNRSISFVHGIGDVVSAVAAAGLRLEFLHEHSHTLFARYGASEKDGPIYRLPEGRPRIPLMYSLRATRA